MRFAIATIRAQSIAIVTHHSNISDNCISCQYLAICNIWSNLDPPPASKMETRGDHRVP